MPQNPSLQAPYTYYRYDGLLCRLKGTFFEGYAEIYVPGEGFREGHFFDIENNGVIISKEEFQEELLALTRK